METAAQRTMDFFTKLSAMQNPRLFLKPDVFQHDLAWTMLGTTSLLQRYTAVHHRPLGVLSVWEVLSQVVGQHLDIGHSCGYTVINSFSF